ncbi:MAG: regulatory protein, FmdB family [Actinobacteria bacterium]|nr:regulatory protein, FmdB family [Actinomycetota bacterium]
MSVPIYEYECDKCNGVTERLQGIHEPSLKKCPSCGGRVHKRMSSGAFVLKGSGFFANDYPHGKSHDNGNGEAAKKPASCPASVGDAAPACAGCPSITRES